MAFKFMDKIPIKESDIQASILKYLYNEGVYCWRNNSVGVYDPVLKIYRKNKGVGYINGVADILGITPRGRFMALEVKRPGEGPSEEQELFLNNILNNKGIAEVICSVAEAEAIIKGVYNERF